MRLPKLAIENSAFVLVIVLLAVSIGVLSFVNMPRSEDPALDFPLFVTVAVYPGTTPKDMEELVVDPIEDRLNELEDLTEIRTSIQEGLAIIRAEGEFGQNTDDLYDEIQAKVNASRSDLPKDLFSLEVTQVQPLDVKILQMALVSDALPYRDIVDVAEDLENELEKVDGVRSVEIEGYPEEEVRIALDMEKLARFNLPLNQVAGIIQGNNANIPGGNLKAGARSFTLKTSGGYQSIEELKNTVISARGESIIRLGDIADVYMGYEDPKYLARYNGKRAVFVSVTQKKGKNILQIADAMEKEIYNFKSDLPPGVELVHAFEQGPAVSARINDFFLNLIQGILLVGAVILLFLGIRNSLIVMTVIPTSAIIAIYLLDVSGYGLQQISIAGLVLALGLLVDNGIVVIENIHRYLNAGKGLVEAAYKGTAEVGWALVSSTATTVLAFFPITQLGGGTGDFIKSLPLTVIFSLLASLVLALAFTPLLASKLMKAKVDEKMNLMERAMEGLVSKVYHRALNFSLARPWAVVMIALASLGGSIALFPLVGVSFFPTADKPLMLIDIDTPQGSNIDKTDEAARFVESVLDTIDIVTDYAMNVGHGNPQIYYNVRPKNFTANHAQALVTLEEWNPDRFYPLIYQLRETFDQYPGAKIKVSELKNGPPSEAPVAIKVIGDDLDTLKNFAYQLEQIIAETPGTINIDNPLAVSKTNLKTRINRDKAAMVGVQLADIDVAVRTAFTGNSLGTMNMPDGEKYPMVARMVQGEDAKVSDFQRISIASVTGAQVPLGQIAQTGI